MKQAVETRMNSVNRHMMGAWWRDTAGKRANVGPRYACERMPQVRVRTCAQGKRVNLCPMSECERMPKVSVW
jgi:hypothetical protein